MLPTGTSTFSAISPAIWSAMTVLLSRSSSMNRRSMTSPKRTRANPGRVRYIST
jgi:hypothetical protein